MNLAGIYRKQLLHLKLRTLEEYGEIRESGVEEMGGCRCSPTDKLCTVHTVLDRVGLSEEMDNLEINNFSSCWATDIVVLK